MPDTAESDKGVIYLQPTYALNPAGPSSSATDSFPCYYCPKVYKGRHARSIWRRHLKDKHGIPLDQQPKRSRWDRDNSATATAPVKKKARRPAPEYGEPFAPGYATKYSETQSTAHPQSAVRAQPAASAPAPPPLPVPAPAYAPYTAYPRGAPSPTHPSPTRTRPPRGTPMSPPHSQHPQHPLSSPQHMRSSPQQHGPPPYYYPPVFSPVFSRPAPPPEENEDAAAVLLALRQGPSSPVRPEARLSSEPDADENDNSPTTNRRRPKPLPRASAKFETSINSPDDDVFAITPAKFPAKRVAFGETPSRGLGETPRGLSDTPRALGETPSRVFAGETPSRGLGDSGAPSAGLMSSPAHPLVSSQLGLATHPGPGVWSAMEAQTPMRR